MRAILLLLAASACTPDIATGSYLCGPNASCPEGQTCNGPDNTCVFDNKAMPFECHPEVMSEPDDTMEQARVVTFNQCVTPAMVSGNCMLEGDTSDWVRFTVPAVCTAVQVEASVSFTIAFERLGFDLWDLDQNAKIASDGDCRSTGEAGEDMRCMKVTLTPGGNYGIHVMPTGEGDCDGSCAYNRYTLRVQLSTPL